MSGMMETAGPSASFAALHEDLVGATLSYVGRSLAQACAAAPHLARAAAKADGLAYAPLASMRRVSTGEAQAEQG